MSADSSTPSVFLSDADCTLWHGDVLETLRELPAESVDCVVTSPPYWGLRDYGTPGQLGLEPTPEQYVERMVEVFREVRRVLAAHGTVWLNLGDSYATNPGNGRGGGEKVEGGTPHYSSANKLGAGLKPKDLVGIPWRVAFALQADGWYLRSDIIWAKPNPMPESVTDRPTKAHEYVFLLSKQPRYFFDQEAVREDVAPSQVGRVRADKFGGSSWKERQQHGEGAVYRLERDDLAGNLSLNDLGLSTESVEGAAVQAFGDKVTDVVISPGNVVLTHSADVDNQAKVGSEAGEGFSAHVDSVQHTVSNVQGACGPVGMTPDRSADDLREMSQPPEKVAPWQNNPHGVGSPAALLWEFEHGSSQSTLDPSLPPEKPRGPDGRRKTTVQGAGGSIQHRDGERWPNGGRNIRSVWEIATQPYPEAHFATFPEELARRCISAGCPEHGVVLDPFVGSGTVPFVARKLGRHAIGIDLNSSYLQLAARRLQQQSLFAEAL